MATHGQGLKRLLRARAKALRTFDQRLADTHEQRLTQSQESLKRDTRATWQKVERHLARMNDLAAGDSNERVGKR
ncbi:hypothetical protein [Halomonas sp. GFAJ-1]|uniref:hypothetical protein n=1 Tax=Halomonas sp. GFAJ-1 TaxID=1118153 RepID=UPI00023A33CF|nr:hypothetical protein [Halomonas sp. GFAJ-1]AVI62983.1 hypothetical protein BB497_09905 [Halomonas sp. GFAJ-1]EHK60291.1 hypothetical protein MOY_11347 [Halomonas sp. GFAJ-1]